MSRKCPPPTIIVAVIYGLLLTNGAITCPVYDGNDEKCNCYYSDSKYEITCPPDEQEILVEVKLQANNNTTNIAVQCTLNDSRSNLYPQLKNLNNLKTIRFKYCPKPIDGFHELFTETFHVHNSPEALVFDGKVQNETRDAFDKEMFANLSGLTKLVLNKNEMTSMDDDLFVYLTNLKFLDLNSNELTYVSAKAFANLTRLEVLELNGNKIERLEIDALRPLTRLKTLLLFDNRLKRLPIGTFDANRDLQVIDLSFNPIETLDGELLKNNVNLSLFCLANTTLDVVPEDLFRANGALKEIRLISNPNLTSLPGALIANHTRLKTLILMNNRNLAGLPMGFFAGCIKLERVDLSYNGFIGLAGDTFDGLSKLKELDLQNNALETIDDDLFAGLRNLQKLVLNNNRLSTIGKNAFSHTAALEHLDLSHNRFVTIEAKLFANLLHLQELNLSYNHIAMDGYDLMKVLGDCLKLRRIDVSHNELASLAEDMFYNFSQLQMVDFSHNQLTSIDLPYLQFLSESVDMYLTDNRITTINMENYREILLTQKYVGNYNLHMKNNPIRCDCHLYDLVTYARNTAVKSLKIVDDMRCASPKTYANVAVERLELDELICPGEKCPESCECNWRAHDKSYTIDCSYKNLTVVPSLRYGNETIQLIEVNLTGNRLTESPKDTDEGYENVTKLFLSDNRIGKLHWIPSTIQELKLDNNRLKELDNNVLRRFNESELNYLSLGNNPWTCDCSMTNFTNYLRSHASQQRIDVIDITCSSSSASFGGKRLVDLNAKNLCKNVTHIFMIWMIVLLCVLVTFITLIALYYRYRLEIKIWLFANNIFLWLVTEEEIDKDKAYDAFLSFAHQDEEYVMGELLPVLENGSQPYKLCVHYRDWIGGELIMTQIVRSIEDSRRTIVVLSEHFLKSVWGTVEFRTAHQKALSEQCARVIIVVYGNVDPDEIIDEELKGYLKTHTYIKWDDKWFWEKLRYAMPHRSTNDNKMKKKTMNEHLRNVFNKIDNLDLVSGGGNVANSVEATTTKSPSVEISLDPLLLKTHDMHFHNDDVNSDNNNRSQQEITGVGNSTPIEENNRRI